jgi:hypothetical protein
MVLMFLLRWGCQLKFLQKETRGVISNNSQHTPRLDSIRNEIRYLSNGKVLACRQIPM